MRIGITGHSNLSAETVPIVRRALDAALTPTPQESWLGSPAWRAAPINCSPKLS
ncbi:hypothetical protein GCM10022402_27790 [Salinactinospora qingdaonensis]|uniref:Uncharacterized protein n=1 Tax=Salinactinospora qingdaonensis TaxID=702744 RepID=A0ABP7FV92_9ACTN